MAFGDTSGTTITTTSPQGLADGHSPVEVTVLVAGQDGTPTPAEVVSLIIAGYAKSDPERGISGRNGEVKFKLVDKHSENVIVTPTISGTPISNNISIFFAPDYGARFNQGQAGGHAKGQGYFGPLLRADGTVMTELSVGVEIDDEEVEIPSIVPTLNLQQLMMLIVLPDGAPVPPDIIEMATQFAKGRIAAGKDPFAGPEEENRGIYPQLPRR